MIKFKYREFGWFRLHTAHAAAYYRMRTPNPEAGPVRERAHRTRSGTPDAATHDGALRRLWDNTRLT